MPRLPSTAGGGQACRISVTDAGKGDTVIRVNHLYQTTPYRSSHPVYVREGEQTSDAIDQVPEPLRRRILSVRGFEDDAMITDAGLAERPQLERIIGQFFGNERTRYLHLHFAKSACYAARVDRK